MMMSRESLVLIVVLVAAVATSCFAASCEICNIQPHGLCCTADFPGSCKVSRPDKMWTFVGSIGPGGSHNDTCQYMSFTWTEPLSGWFVSTCAERWDDSTLSQTYKVSWQTQFNGGGWMDKFVIKCNP
jgi:hypothetical protein